jgi:uncharacterized protein (DUF885 family)
MPTAADDKWEPSDMNSDFLICLDEFADIHRQLQKILQSLVMNDITIIDALSQMLHAIQHMHAQAEQAQERAEEVRTRLVASVDALSRFSDTQSR